MRAVVLLSAGLLIASTAAPGEPCRCLPDGIDPTDVVSTEAQRPGLLPGDVRTITVRDKLKELGARCRSGTLVDASDQEIYFFRLVGCWGNPPAGYREMLQQQDRDLARLRARYRVIEMTCNPSGGPVF